MNNKNRTAIFQAILAAVCYGVSTPISKILLEKIPPLFMAALLYLGAGIGMLIFNIFKNSRKVGLKEAKMTKKELPYIIGMIVLDIIAPIFLMIGLTMSSPANVSLLNNFEIVATALIALLIFKESVGKRMWIAITLITISSIFLSFEDISSLSFSMGSVFILLACLSWGFENNCTRMLSLKDPLQIVIVKGFGSGTGALLIALVMKEHTGNVLYIGLALLLGFFAYGLSIYFYILAQRELGAARTSAYYAVAPFVGVGLSFLMFNQNITFVFIFSLAIMIIGTYFASVEKHNHLHFHETLEHEHRHTHNDEHHLHDDDIESNQEHSHKHTHVKSTHAHNHTPDLHHVHNH